jgi:hypothetical protein
MVVESTSSVLQWNKGSSGCVSFQVQPRTKPRGVSRDSTTIVSIVEAPVDQTMKHGERLFLEVLQ